MQNSLNGIKLLLFLLLILTCVSCKKVKRLSDADRAWMPYNGNETLVFCSNNGELDTVFLIGKDTSWGYPDPIFSSSKYEILSVYSKFKDMDDDGLGYRYLDGLFVSVKRTMNISSELLIRFNAKDASYYRLNHILIDSLTNVEATSLNVMDKLYSDVYIFVGEDYVDGFRERTNFITRIYWSKSAGVIRYDKKNDEYWELSKKYKVNF